MAPLILTPVPDEDVARGDGPLVSEFIESFCTVSMDSLAGSAGSPIVLRQWQHELLARLFARREDGRYRHRTALIGMPRKNGKSSLSSGIALYGLLFGGGGAQVFSCAGDKEQARIVFGETKRMIEADPELSEMCKTYRDAIEGPNNSVYRCLSAEAYTKEGLNPTLVVFDEVHVQPNDDLWAVMRNAMGARIEPMMVGITTAGVRFNSAGEDSLCYRMWQMGRRVASGEIENPSFFMSWWGAPDGADHTDPEVWRAANPGYDDLIDPEDFAATLHATSEAEFRIKRLSQWVSKASMWLPAGVWADCESAGSIEDGSNVVLGFDGSFSGDSTALVAVEVSDKPHVQVVRLWESRDHDGPDDFRVPIADVEDAIRNACRRWQVVEIVCDPFRWARTLQILEAEGLPIVEFPQNQTRMTPATNRFYEAVMNKALTHSGDPVLARHIDNCVLKVDSRGTRLAKEHRGSARKIDAAVAAVMAFDRAAFYAADGLSDSIFFDLSDV